MADTQKEIVYDALVIGGGASGFFAAIQAAGHGKNKVLLLEKTPKLLSKVSISGGGRCNVTHEASNVNALSKSYPRGGKSLKKPFSLFNNTHTCAWFEQRGVKLKTESDGRIFPVSDKSESIVQALMDEAGKNHIEIKTRQELRALKKTEEWFEVHTFTQAYKAKFVVLAVGGHAKASFYQLFKDIGLSVHKPVPSLFTFNVPDSPAKELMGLSVPKAQVRIPGSKWKQDGPLLITHWGFSAPAVILLSAWAALDLYQRQYQFPIALNWTGLNEEKVRISLANFAREHHLKQVRNQNPFALPSRLWQYLAGRAQVKTTQKWHDLPKKQFNKLITHLVADDYEVNGKTTFKEEFVSCGGVELKEVALPHFESKKIPGLFVVGELLNVDGITGGFNFQHAWTSGYLAGEKIASYL